MTIPITAIIVAVKESYVAIMIRISGLLLQGM